MSESVKADQNTTRRSCHRSFFNGTMQNVCIQDGCSLWSQQHEACADLVTAAGTAKIAEASLTANDLQIKSIEVLSSLAVSCDHISNQLSKRRVL